MSARDERRRRSVEGGHAVDDIETRAGRRAVLRSLFGALGAGLLANCARAQELKYEPYGSAPEAEAAKAAAERADALDRRAGAIRITKLETFLVKPRWLFLKVHTDAGITGLGEPLVEGRALTVKTAVEEIAPYLIGKD